MDPGQSSQSNLQRTEFIKSPFKETQTKAVREYEETISQLKKENFDLKVRLYLCEEAHKETYHAKGSYNDEKEDCIQVIVNLKIEAEDLKKELKGKDEEIHNAVEKYSSDAIKYQTELEEAKKKINEQKEFIEILEQLPTAEDYDEVKRQYSAMVSDSEHMRLLLSEKDEEIEKLQKELVVYNKKVKQRDEAIKACALKYHKELDHIPKDLRPVIKSAIEAAVNNDEKLLLSSLEDFKTALYEITGVPISPNRHSTNVGGSFKQNSSSAHTSGSSGSSFEKSLSGFYSNENGASQSSECLPLEGDLDPAEIAALNVRKKYNRRIVSSNIRSDCKKRLTYTKV